MGPISIGSLVFLAVTVVVLGVVIWQNLGQIERLLERNQDLREQNELILESIKQLPDISYVHHTLDTPSGCQCPGCSPPPPLTPEHKQKLQQIQKELNQP